MSAREFCVFGADAAAFDCVATIPATAVATSAPTQSSCFRLDSVSNFLFDCGKQKLSCLRHRSKLK